jgi:uncharacterized protein YyaL (SSP411 family)
MEQHEFTNHLIHESSPYLLQHAHNPVDWYPWGDDAFAKARAENKPVLLSIGYSACHWCHVMAHESFEDEEIARLMNDNFVNIKVDREERPDLDQIYMNAVQMMTHHGGWAHDCVPHSRRRAVLRRHSTSRRRIATTCQGFPRVLISVAEAYRDRPQDIAETGTSLLNELRRLSQTSGSDHPIEKELLDASYLGAIRNYDATNGGFGGAPKFPPAMTLEFLLRTYHRTGNQDALDMVTHTCRKMAEGGIYDQLGGGFHRYSTDARWLVPHFEKMLYDNALLSRLYLHHFQVTGDTASRETSEGVLDYVFARDDRTPAAAFTPPRTPTRKVTKESSSSGTSTRSAPRSANPRRPSSPTTTTSPPPETSKGRTFPTSRDHSKTSPSPITVSLEEIRDSLSRSKQTLFDLRQRRIKPDRDEKIITAWNGLMLASFAEAGVILDRPDYTAAARRNAEFVLSKLRRDGLLLRTFKDGVAKFNAYLEDYAFFSEGLVTLYETTGESRWLKEALALTDRMIDEFWDEENGGFFFTGKSHENLIVRSKDYFRQRHPIGKLGCGRSPAASRRLNRRRALPQSRRGGLSGSGRYSETIRGRFRLFAFGDRFSALHSQGSRHRRPRCDRRSTIAQRNVAQVSAKQGRRSRFRRRD